MIVASPSGKAYRLFLDALDQPHLLIAGATGSGKSVIENGLIHHLLYRLPGDQPGRAELILIDPKRVELIRYKDMPHTLLYTSNPDEFPGALRAALRLTEDRYKTMQRRRELSYSGGDLYIFIDEWADLMATSKREVLPTVQRLAQIGRAAKVHVVLCTQSPIAKIIPTEVKVNFDARFGLRTRSAQDSRNIIGVNGCETLPRYGQCYFMSPDTFGPELYEVPCVTPAQIEAQINHWYDQRPSRQFFKTLSDAFKRGRPLLGGR